WAAGRRGAVEGLGLEAAGIATDERGRIAVDARFRTANPDVLAVGDAVGWLPSLSSTPAAQGRFAAAPAFGVDARLDPRTLPFALHAIPELASVGAAPHGRDVVVGRAQLGAHGLLHLVAEVPSGRIVAAYVVGTDAGELVHVGALAVQQG